MKPALTGMAMMFVIGSALGAAQAQTQAAGFQKAPQAQCTLYNTRGEVIGQAQLQETNSGVLIRVVINQMNPGTYGFHIHERGDFSIPNFKGAGDHFNPFRREHGFLNPQGPHAGDLPNLHVGVSGSLDLEMVTPSVTLVAGTPRALLKPGGTSLIIHATPDDYKTGPSGDSGERIAGGPIQAVNP